MPFSKGVEKYFKQEVKLNETKTIEDKQATFKAFATLFPNADVGLIDKAQASDFKDLLLQGQANIARINKKLGHMSHFMGWAMIHGHAESNPFKGLEVGTRSQAAKLVDSYEQFTSEHLRRIFDPESYAEYADGKPHFYWLPFLLLHTGARPEELAGINLRNVCYEEEIHFFRVRSGKTTNSQRRIPFHKAVRESAFMDYLKKRKEEDPAGQLFPLLKDGKNGYLKNVSRRFNEIYLVKNLKIDEKTRKLYSFRTTFINGLTQSTGENAAKVMAIVGHYNQAGLDLSGVHFSTYQQDKPLKFLQQVMDSYHTIELPMKF
ncbi:hypothetical protein CS062_00480 [Roseateles chitinivorans]|uniref:Tyr recombinase domain-containing protein n=1 Tax=Roseateles chitinivorans TaxID=2917965 RepID=A0A2G9CF31_9BURK|nr:tyrosine-type recombinase/integrase [Roseateles chitinivorans]PIM55046.1 hypothetical protein CS062_00480 [Roseateles chitinivorans]